MNRRDVIKVICFLAIVAVCLVEFMLLRQSGMFRDLETRLFQVSWALLGCLVVWFSTLLCPAFGLRDLPLIGLLLIAVTAYAIGYGAVWQGPGALTLLTGVTLGRAAHFALN